MPAGTTNVRTMETNIVVIVVSGGIVPFMCETWPELSIINNN